MKKMSKSLARSFSSNRRLGTKAQVAGKATYLPNRKVPRAVQKLTLAQVKREKGSAKTDSTKEYATIVGLLNQVRQQVESIYIDNRVLSRNQKDAPPEDCGIFFPPIDEGKLSDCIRLIITQFFGDSDRGKICGRTTKLVEFCVLMFCYFTRIKILKNRALKPFSDFLAARVFTDESKFTARTFNNYANDPSFEKVKDGFTSSEKLKINFSRHPVPTGTLQDVFHEIGWNFHHSPYFDELREQKKNMVDFLI